METVITAVITTFLTNLAWRGVVYWRAQRLRNLHTLRTPVAQESVWLERLEGGGFRFKGTPARQGRAGHNPPLQAKDTQDISEALSHLYENEAITDEQARDLLKDAKALTENPWGDEVNPAPSS